MKKVSKIFLFILIFLFCFAILNNVLKKKDFFNQHYDFLNGPKQYDVIYYGSSHVRNVF